jgi:hypothetical protein
VNARTLSETSAMLSKEGNGMNCSFHKEIKSKAICKICNKQFCSECLQSFISEDEGLCYFCAYNPQNGIIKSKEIDNDNQTTRYKEKEDNSVYLKNIILFLASIYFLWQGIDGLYTGNVTIRGRGSNGFIMTGDSAIYFSLGCILFGIILIKTPIVLLYQFLLRKLKRK